MAEREREEKKLINIQAIQKLSADSRTNESTTGLKLHIEGLPLSINTPNVVHPMLCRAHSYPPLLPFLLKIAPILGFPSSLLYLEKKHINKAKPLLRDGEKCATPEFSKTRETVLVLCLLQSTAQQRAINKLHTEMYNENVPTQSQAQIL